MMDIDILSLLSDTNSKYFVVPSVSLALSTFLKYFCQNDKYAALSWELFYWGPNLMTTALLLIFLDYAAYCNAEITTEKSKDYGNLMFIYIVIVFFMMLLIRKKGWKPNSIGGVRHAHVLGIILPNIIGFAYLYYILYVFSV